MATVHIDITKDPKFNSEDLNAMRKIVRNRDKYLFNGHREISTRVRKDGALYGFTIVSDRDDIKMLFVVLKMIFKKSPYIVSVANDIIKNGPRSLRYGHSFHDDYATMPMASYDRIRHEVEAEIQYNLCIA